MLPSNVLHEGGDGSDELEPLPALVATAVTTLTLTVAFSALALGFSWFWVAFPVGFGGLLPLAVDAARYWTESTKSVERGDEADADTPLARLRARYVRGDLSEEAFERRVEVLLESETRGDGFENGVNTR